MNLVLIRMILYIWHLRISWDRQKNRQYVSGTIVAICFPGFVSRGFSRERRI